MPDKIATTDPEYSSSMLPDLSRLTLGPQIGIPPDFTKKALEKAKDARRGVVQSNQAAKRDEANARRRLPELYGSRTYPGLLRSTEKEHLEIAALMCYTQGWDALLSRLFSNASLNPSAAFRKVVRDQGMIRLKEAQWAMYAMFMDTAEFIHLKGGVPISGRRLQFSIDPEKYCELKDQESYNPFDKLGLRVASIPNIVISSDLLQARTREVVPTAREILDGVKELLPKLFNRYAADHAAAANLFDGAVRNMQSLLFGCFRPISVYKVAPCTLEYAPSGRYVLYRGNTVEVEPGDTFQEAAEVGQNRLISTSRNINSAMEFVKTGISYCCLNVFLVDPGCRVIDVNAFMGISEEGPQLVCYKGECEVIMEPGCRYEKLGSTDQALQNTLISDMMGTDDYKIRANELQTLRARKSTWWRVMPKGVVILGTSVSRSAIGAWSEMPCRPAEKLA